MNNTSIAIKPSSATCLAPNASYGARTGPDDPAHHAMLAALESWGRAAVLIDASKHIVCLNPSAQALIGDGLLISQNRLRASTRAADTALQALLEGAVADATPYRSTGLPLPRRTGRPLIVHSAAAPVGSSRIFGEAKALVTLTSLDNPPGAGATLIAQAYGLTPAEKALCRHLALGAALCDAAKALGVSMSTVRTHLKGAFLKTGTHRQSELVALLGQAAYSLWVTSEPAPYRTAA